MGGLGSERGVAVCFNLSRYCTLYRKCDYGELCVGRLGDCFCCLFIDVVFF
jgi:hypothetical protein